MSAVEFKMDQALQALREVKKIADDVAKQAHKLVNVAVGQQEVTTQMRETLEEQLRTMNQRLAALDEKVEKLLNDRAPLSGEGE